MKNRKVKKLSEYNFGDYKQLIIILILLVIGVSSFKFSIFAGIVFSIAYLIITLGFICLVYSTRNMLEDYNEELKNKPYNIVEVIGDYLLNKTF